MTNKREPAKHYDEIFIAYLGKVSEFKGFPTNCHCGKRVENVTLFWKHARQDHGERIVKPKT